MKTLCKRLGLNAKETDTFLALLKLGAQPVSVVAKNVGVPRSSMYFIIDHLKELNLIETFERKNIKYVKCIPVDSIEDVLRSREREIEQTIDLLHEKLPQLQALESTLSITPKIKFYEGKDEVLHMLNHICQEPNYCAIADLGAIKEQMPKYFDDLPKAIMAKGGSARELLVDNEGAREYMEKYNSKRHQLKLLPKHMVFASDVLIGQKNLYLTTYGDGQVSAIEIYSPALRDTHQAIFEQLWAANDCPSDDVS